MVKCTLGKLFALTDVMGESPLSRLGRLTGLKSAKIKWKVVVLLDEIKKVLSPTEEPRKDLLSRYGQPHPENPSLWQLKPETLDEYKKQAEEFAATVVEVSVTPLSLEDLEGSNVEVGDMILLRDAGLLVEE